MHCEHGSFLLCFFYSGKGDDFSDQSRLLLQLSGISEIAKGMEGDRHDDIQTNEENKSSTQIMFAGDLHELLNKLYKTKTFAFATFCVFSFSSSPLCLFT